MGAMERRKRTENRERWRQHVTQWRESGLSAAAYAAREHISVHSLRWWQGRLPMEGTAGGSSAPGSGAEPWPFIELCAPGGTSARDDRFEVELGPGRRLRIPPRFETEAVRRLLMLLQEGT